MSSNPVLQTEALQRAQSGQSFANYAPIFEGFLRMGIVEAEIRPRENVFTYNAWRALGRQVRKGQHGVKCLTFINTVDKQTGESRRRPWHTTVFHVSQTDAIGAVALPELDATGENVEHAGETEPSAPTARRMGKVAF
jgi:hypothetical protein